MYSLYAQSYIVMFHLTLEVRLDEGGVGRSIAGEHHSDMRRVLKNALLRRCDIYRQISGIHAQQMRIS